LASGINGADLKLGKLNVNPGTVTLSGFSSGGGIAQELFVAYSSLFRGIAVFQQTFYRCGSGKGDVEEFDRQCTNLGNDTEGRVPYDPQNAVNDIRSYFQQGLIEDPANLKDKRLYVYAGLQNFIFKPEMMLNILKVFEPFIDNPLTIRTRVQNAGYLLPTATFGDPCNKTIASRESHYWIGNCKLNGPHEALSFLLGEEAVALPEATTRINLDSLVKFDQTEFFQGINRTHFMAPSGYLYVPKGCENSYNRECSLHVYFHGCGTGSDSNDGQHMIKSGFLELAEKNHIILLFPQIQKDSVNYLGCWDSFGNTGPDYATQKGVQVDIMQKILRRIAPEIRATESTTNSGTTSTTTSTTTAKPLTQ